MSGNDLTDDRSRRTILKGLGVSGTALIAGCTGKSKDGAGDETSTSGNDNSSGESDSTQSEDSTSTSDETTEVLDVTFNQVAPARDNSQLNLNPYDVRANTGLGRVRAWFFEKRSNYLFPKGEYASQIFDSWNMNGSTFTVKLKEGYTWWPSGDPVTAEDIHAQYKLDGHVYGDQAWNEISIKDDHTIEFQIDKRNPNTLLPSLISGYARIKKDLYAEPLEKFADATTDEERKAAKNNLIKDFQIKEPYGNGVFELTEITPQRVIGERYDAHPQAENVNFKHVESRGVSDSQAMYQEAMADNIDSMVRQVPPKIEEQLGDNWNRGNIPQYGGQVLGFSPKSDDFGIGKRAARHAVGYLLSPQKFSKLTGKPKPDFLQTAMPGFAEEKYLNEEVRNALNDYGLGSKQQKATEVLKGAGYTQENGEWYRPDGSRFKTTFHYPAGWSANITGYKALGEALNNFGIKTKVIGQEVSTFLSQTVGNYDFNLAVSGTFTAKPNGYPYYGFLTSMGTIENNKWNYNPTRETMKVPMPAGNPDGSMEKVEINPLLEELSQTTDENRANEIIETLAWTHNQWLGFFRLNRKIRPNFMNTNEFEYEVSTDAPAMGSRAPWAFLARKGKMHAKK